MASSQDLGGLESLQVLLQQNPDSLTFGRVADALMQQGRLDEAIQICEEGIRRHPYYVTGHMVLGKCYLKKKLFDQAEKEFKRVLLFDPKYIAAHKYYGDLMREIGWDNTCEMSYRKILQIDPLDDAVQNVVDEFASKATRARPEPPVSRPAAKPVIPTPSPAATSKPTAPSKPPATTIPISEEDLLSTTGVEESDFLRYQPPPEEAKPITPLEMETAPESQYAAPPGTPPESDEERYSYILDDIFKDEMLDEKPSRPIPPTHEGPSIAQRAADSETIFASEFPGDNEFDQDEGVAFKEQPESFTSDNNRLPSREPSKAPVPLQPASKIPTTPVDFDLDFDEAPPADFASSEIGPAAKSTEADNAQPPQDQKDLPPVVWPGRPATGTVTPTRRMQFLDELEQPEPLLLPPSGEREKIVTPTLGEIYAAQGQYAKAIGVFELLSKKDPNNRNYRDKIEYLKKRLQETQNAR